MKRLEIPKNGLLKKESGDKLKHEIEKIKGDINDIFVREVPKEYEELAFKAKLVELSEPYEELLYERFFNGEQDLSELGTILSEAMKDEIVLDLGCGKTDNISRFAKKNATNLFIGVDLNPDIFTPIVIVTKRKKEPPYYLNSKYWPRCDTVIEDNLSSVEPEKKVFTEPEYNLQDNILQVRDDMLRAISRVKNDIINVIIISGIEMSYQNMKETGEYLSRLKDEIKRVQKKDGLLLINQSDFISDNDYITVISNKEEEWEVLKKKESIE